jgi:hypothetical protein
VEFATIRKMVCSTKPSSEWNQLAMFPILDAEWVDIVDMYCILLRYYPLCSSKCIGHYTRYFAGSYVHDMFIKALNRGVRVLGKQCFFVFLPEEVFSHPIGTRPVHQLEILSGILKANHISRKRRVTM